MTQYKTSYAERWPQYLMWLLVIVLAVSPFVLGRWAWQPIIVVATGVIATQIASRFGQTTLEALAKTFTYNGSSDRQEAIASESAETGVAQIKEVIEMRIRKGNKEAREALESYLNQVVGSWGMVILVVGAIVAIVVRPYLGIPNPSWMNLVLIVSILLTVALLIWLTTTGFVGSRAIMIYYGHHKLAPPSGPLTVFRASVLIIYSFLIFVGYWPSSGNAPQIGVGTSGGFQSNSFRASVMGHDSTNALAAKQATNTQPVSAP